MSNAQTHYEQWPAEIAAMKEAAPEIGRAFGGVFRKLMGAERLCAQQVAGHGSVIGVKYEIRGAVERLAVLREPALIAEGAPEIRRVYAGTCNERAGRDEAGGRSSQMIHFELRFVEFEELSRSCCGPRRGAPRIRIRLPCEPTSSSTNGPMSLTLTMPSLLRSAR